MKSRWTPVCSAGCHFFPLKNKSIHHGNICVWPVFTGLIEWRWVTSGFLHSWGLEALLAFMACWRKLLLSPSETFCTSFTVPWIGWTIRNPSLVSLAGTAVTVLILYIQSCHRIIMVYLWGKDLILAFHHFLAYKYQTAISLDSIVLRCF